MRAVFFGGERRKGGVYRVENVVLNYTLHSTAHQPPKERGTGAPPLKKGRVKVNNDVMLVKRVADQGGKEPERAVV